MKVRGIIFDLDGTLVDSISDITDAANLALHSRGFPEHQTADYLNWIGNGAARLIEAALPKGVDSDAIENIVTEFKSNYRRKLHEKTKLYEGIAELLNFLTEKGIVLAILSNKPHELTIEVVNWFLSAWPFALVVGQRNHIPRKPDPTAAVMMAEKMGILPSEMLFVGDSRNDQVTAREGGFIPVGVSWGYGDRETLIENGASRIVDSPQELMKMLSENWY